MLLGVPLATYAYENLTSNWSLEERLFRAAYPAIVGSLLLGAGLSFDFALRHNPQTTRRREAGQCIHCGYDLRTTKGICPECGHTTRSRQ